MMLGTRGLSISRIVIAFLFISMLSPTFIVQSVKAEPKTVYIKANGSIEPDTAPIYTTDNVTYTFADNINDSIVVERDNIIVDGAFHIVQGIGNGQGDGIRLLERTNVTIKNMTIRAFGQGISIGPYSSYITIFGNNIANNYGPGYSLYIVNSPNNIICGNNITDNGGGIELYNSAGNSIHGNNIVANIAWGIGIGYYSSNNTIYGNNITNNFKGIGLDSYSNNNTIYHNNFINNYTQVTSFDSTNVWDNGVEGNYWSDYNGSDGNQDGIGDTPYIINENNTDHYPLMGTFQNFNVSGWGFHTLFSFEEVDIISNSTIGNVWLLWADDVRSPTGMIWYLYLRGVVGQNGTTGFCRVTFPNDMLNSSDYSVFMGNLSSILEESSQIPSRILRSNGTHTTLYFTYSQPIPNGTPLNGIYILPEFQPLLILPLFAIATLSAAIITRRKRARIGQTNCHTNP